MEKNHPHFYARKNQVRLIQEFVRKPGSQLTYLRGRRRIGKSALLQFVQSGTPNCFYFAGAPDARKEQALRDFAYAWDRFDPGSHLSELNSLAQNWARFFQEIAQKAKKSQQPLVLFFDEIQWMATKGSGFIGRLKAAWDEWKQTGRIKLILCGSSNKFFHQHAGGEEKILRGLKTFAEIWVPPFTLGEIKKFYFPEWNHEEICLVTMMVGGIPYYLEQIPRESNFIRAVNQAFFTRSTIFLDEINEILSLEFNKSGAKTVRLVLSAVAGKGATEQTIKEKTGLAKSTIHDSLNKLIDYQLVFYESPMHARPKKNDAGVRYYLKDFYLNFYFKILERLEIRIKKNEKSLLFPCECLDSKSGFYIPLFSGDAFEKLVRNILENKMDMKAPLFEKLALMDEDYQIGSYWDRDSQIDLVVEHQGDREARLIECKWVSNKLPSTVFSDILSKKYPLPKDYRKKNFLISSCFVLKKLKKQSSAGDIILLTLEDLF